MKVTLDQEDEIVTFILKHNPDLEYLLVLEENWFLFSSSGDEYSSVLFHYSVGKVEGPFTSTRTIPLTLNNK